jgi:hypothetical protein
MSGVFFRCWLDFNGLKKPVFRHLNAVLPPTKLVFQPAIGGLNTIDFLKKFFTMQPKDRILGPSLTKVSFSV